METKLQKYQPLAKVLMYDGETFFVPAEEQDSIQLDMNSNPYGAVKLNGQTVKYKDIKKIIPHVAMGYEDLPKPQRMKVEQMIQTYRDNLAEYPSEKTIEVMVRRVLSGEV